jgi:hypothetical protein
MPRPSLLRTRIAKARNVTGLQQKEFSDLTGVPLNTLRRYENGDNRLPAWAAAKISQQTGISAHWLMGSGKDEHIPLAIHGGPFDFDFFDRFVKNEKHARDWDTRSVAWAEYLRGLMLGILIGWRGTSMVEELGASIDEAVSEVVKKYYLVIHSEFKSVDEVARYLAKRKKIQVKRPNASSGKRNIQN